MPQQLRDIEQPSQMRYEALFTLESDFPNFTALEKSILWFVCDTFFGRCMSDLSGLNFQLRIQLLNANGFLNPIPNFRLDEANLLSGLPKRKWFGLKLCAVSIMVSDATQPS